MWDNVVREINAVKLNDSENSAILNLSNGIKVLILPKGEQEVFNTLFKASEQTPEIQAIITKGAQDEAEGRKELSLANSEKEQAERENNQAKIDAANQKIAAANKKITIGQNTQLAAKNIAQINALSGVAKYKNAKNPQSYIAKEEIANLNNLVANAGNETQGVETVIVTGYKKNATLGDKFVGFTVSTKELYDSVDPQTKDLIVRATNAAKSGGLAGAFINYAIEKGVASQVDKLPLEKLAPLAQKLNDFNAWVGNSEVSFLKNKPFETLQTNNPDKAQKQSEAMYWATETVFIPGAVNHVLSKVKFSFDMKKSKVNEEIDALRRIKEANKNATDLSLKDPNSVLYKQAETISTAKGTQRNSPSDLIEQFLWNQVKNNPEKGEILHLSGDKRFPISEGFQKMQITHRTLDGKVVTIHYQYNSVTKKAYDMKIVSRPINQQKPK